MRPQPDVSSIEKNPDYAELVTKQVDIQGMPEGWKLSSLISAVGGVNSLVVGGPFGSNLKVEHYQKSGIPIIRLQNIDFTRFIKKDFKYVSPEKAKELFYHSYKAGDIVLAKLGNPIGKSCLVPADFEDGIVVADVVRIRNKNHELDNQYLMYALNSQNTLNQLNRQVRGSTRPRVNVSEVRQLVISIPPLHVQRAIARVLRAVQEAKSARHSEIKLELERKAALMQHLFSHGTRGESTKQTEIGVIPKNWSLTKVDSIKAQQKGSLAAGPFGSNIGKRFFVASGVPVIRGNNLSKGDSYFKDSGFVFVTEQKAKELKSCEALLHDLILTAAGTLGQVGIIPEASAYPKYIISNKQIRLRVDINRVNPIFLFYWLSSSIIQNEIKKRASGTSIPVINLGIVRNLPVILPSMDEQLEILGILQTCDAKISALENEIKLLAELFTAILEELMTGKLDTNPLEEVAVA